MGVPVVGWMVDDNPFCAVFIYGEFTIPNATATKKRPQAILQLCRRPQMVAPGLTIRCIKLSCGIRRWSAGGTTRTQKTPVRRAFFIPQRWCRGVIHTP